MIRVIFLSMISTYCLAVDPNPILEKLTVNHSKIQCHENYSEAQKLAKECAKTICGPANKIPPSVIEAEHFDQYDFSEAEKRFTQIEDSLVKIIKSEHEIGTKVLKKLKEKIEKGIDLNSKEASQYISQATSDDLLIQQDIDKKKLSISMRGYNKRTKKKKEMIDAYIKWLEDNLQKSSELKRQYGLYLSIEEKKRFLEEKMFEIDNALLTIKKINEYESRLLNLTKDGISFYKKGMAIPSYALDILIKESEQLQNILEAKYNSKFKITEISFCDKKCLEFFKSDEFKKGILASIDKQLEMNKKADFDPAKLVKSCKAPFYLDAYNKAIYNKMDLREVMNDINFASESLSRYLDNDFSSETANLIKEKFTQLKSVIISGKPMVGGEYSLKSHQMENFANNYKAFQVEDLSDFKLFRVGMTGSSSYQYLMSRCSGISNGLNIVDDFFNPFFEQINISSFSCEHEIAGGQIIVHELGHMLSSMVKNGSTSKESRGKFLEKRECVSSRHIHKNYGIKSSLKHYDDHLYSEEDFADYLSDKTFGSYKKIGNSKFLQYCTLLPVRSGEYLELKTQFKEGDSHSPAIYRVINSLLNKGVKLPDSCQGFLEKQLVPYIPKSCE